MAYTGSGTQNDPIVIDNWEDLKTQMMRSGIWISLDPDAENKVIDFLDTEEKAGLTQIFSLRAHILGNGWTFRNVICQQNGYFFNNNVIATIQDLHFENILILGEYLFNGKYNFVNCQFTAMLQKYATLHRSTYSNYTGCSFHLYFSPSCTNFYNGVILQSILTGCTIHLRGKWNGGKLFNNKLHCSQVTGSLELAGDLELGSNAEDENSFYDLTLTGTGGVQETAAGGSANLVNISAFGDGVTYSITGNNWHALTEEQLKDAAYLLEIGFPCVEA